MADLNISAFTGRLTRDPELKVVGQQGTAVCEFSIAVNEYWKGAENDQYTSFFNVKAWGKKAEIISKYFKKGSPIAFSGSLRQDRWPNAEGKTMSRVIINLTDLTFIGGNKSSNDSQNTGNQQKAGEDNQDHAPYNNSGFGDDGLPEDDIPF